MSIGGIREESTTTIQYETDVSCVRRSKPSADPAAYEAITTVDHIDVQQSHWICMHVASPMGPEFVQYYPDGFCNSRIE